MQPKLPSVRYFCPCTELKSGLSSVTDSTDYEVKAEENSQQEEQQQTLDPHSPRANFNLFPLENLAFCNECYELRCPKCYYEEALQYYCPSCLFESQSTIVKNETNRCTRSCFQCPICVAPLQASNYQDLEDHRPESQDGAAVRDGPCILSCPSCHWTSLEIGVVFEKPVNISGQLAKIKNDKTRTSAVGEWQPNISSDSEKSNPSQSAPNQYTQLVSFYKNQVTETTPSGPFGLTHSFGLDSPNQLSRLLSTYGLPGLKKQREKLPVMRESLYKSEGLRIETSLDSDEHIISQMQTLGWDGTASVGQQSHQSNPVRFLSDLRPVSTRLRSRCSKRCRACRYHLVKSEEKRGKYRHQIKLVALNFVPTITVRPFDPSADLQSLVPSKTTQLLLTFRNPLFDSVKITLATSRVTPGKIPSKVTVLCPQFEIGANTDVWDDALDTTAVERRKAREALEGIQPEAGKVWDKGRNWTSIIVEVVAGSLPAAKTHDSREANHQAESEPAPKTTIDDYDVEIPIFLRLEHETDDTGGDNLNEDAAATNTKDRRVKRELSYWCVVSAGRIQSS